jgi:hypothetical protein
MAGLWQSSFWAAALVADAQPLLAAAALDRHAGHAAVVKAMSWLSENVGEAMALKAELNQ